MGHIVAASMYNPGKAADVVPSDSADINHNGATGVALYVGVQGDVVVEAADNATQVTLKNAVGWQPCRVKKVLSTGTTAEDIVAWW